MKKTLISIVLIVSLLSTALFSVVFAAYSVQDSGTVTATVSGFGVTVDVVAATAATDIQLKPQATGTLISVTSTGTPSVAANLSYASTVTLSDWMIDTDADGQKDDFYCPIIFTITKTNPAGGEAIVTTIDGTDKTGENPTYADADALASAIKTAIDTSAPLTAGNSVDGKYNVTVSWNWAGANSSKAFDSALSARTAENPAVTPQIIIQVDAAIEQQ